jgi:hypothetical protein
VGLVSQRSQDAAGDLGNLGIAWPAGDGEHLRNFDETSVRIRHRLIGDFEDPCEQFFRQRVGVLARVNLAFT